VPVVAAAYRLVSTNRPRAPGTATMHSLATPVVGGSTVSTGDGVLMSGHPDCYLTAVESDNAKLVGALTDIGQRQHTACRCLVNIGGSHTVNENHQLPGSVMNRHSRCMPFIATSREPEACPAAGQQRATGVCFAFSVITFPVYQSKKPAQ